MRSTELLLKQKCGKRSNANADSVLRSIFLGHGFAKPRQLFSAEIRFGFPRAGRVWEGMRADFGAG
ncbi:MAG: hypothetical protein A2915_01090 [Candidatus Yanofskybacteria bacterium RIFCSPLOWO2_01_FULL_41_34]|nr:MAG: hypothetical protein A2915_01090 [Candidatus Yanofskybacteria bacterium RIFCSPLOWO2_01_FULL_41_34]